MTRDETIKEILVDTLNCGYSDVDLVISLYKMALKIGAIEGFYNVVDKAEDLGYEKLDCNVVIYVLMREIVYSLAEDVGEDFREWLDEEWSPYVNYLDSWFNIDPLDEVKWNGKRVNREKLVRELKKWFKNNKK